MKTNRRWGVAAACISTLLGTATVRAGYADIYEAMEDLHGTARWPVPSADYDDIDSVFGVRTHITTGYDFHRGIDIRGNIGKNVVAALNGTFWSYSTTSSGNNIMTLRHRLASPITLNGRTFNYFYTQYHHLDNDTEDIIEDWDEQETTVTAGQHIAELGDSGVQGEPHLHYELRFGTRFSLEAQLDSDDITDYGFDPHLHPMLLYEPYTYNSSGSPGTYHQQIALTEPVSTGEDIELEYTISNDEMPLLNAVTVMIKRDSDGAVVKQHTLNYNERIGFDATTNAALDTPDTAAPYFVPQSFVNNATVYETGITIPSIWWSSYALGHSITVNVADIWGHTESLQIITHSPEPGTLGAMAMVFMAATRCGRCVRRA